MSALRTSIVAIAVGGAAVTAGVVATSSANAEPAPLSAVSTVAETTGVADAAGTTTATGAAARPQVRHWWKNLSDTQRRCLQDQKVTRPVGPLDDAQRAALKAKVEAAAKTCGVELPFPKMRAFWDGLTDTQRQCLKSADVSRPWGPMSKEQRQQVRKDLEAAAQKCGVTLPTKPANPTPAPSATTSPSALLT